MTAWFYTWFDWVGAGAALGEDNYGAQYTWGDVLGVIYIPLSEEAGTVTFAEYPPKGWLGWCSVENCEGQTPSGIIAGYEYNTQYYYFVYYATADALSETFAEDGTMVAEVESYKEAYFTWIVEEEEGPALPDNSAVAAILQGIGAPSAPLTVTLLWNADVDLDLWFSCDDGTNIYYNNLVADECTGTLDADAQADKFNAVRGDGTLGQVENISVQQPVEGHEYAGKVQYYIGNGNAAFQIIFSGTDPEGVLHVFGQEHVADFASAGLEHPYHFTYSMN